MTFLNTILENILEIVFPMKCVACKQSGSEFCIACLGEIPGAERECALWIYPAFDYRHPPLKQALWLLKYKNKKRVARIFGEILYGKIMEELAELGPLNNFRDPLVIPIPLSAKRYRERGYNQAELIVKELIRLDTAHDLQFEKNILLKIKDNEHQARIKNKSERLKNIIDSFAVSEKYQDTLKNRNIILIDDIITTGATLTEAKKILKKHGVRKVIAFTVAH